MSVVSCHVRTGKRALIAPMLCLLAIAGAGCSKREISGKVRACVSDDPVPGAAVSSQTSRATTDGTGTFRLSTPPEDATTRIAVEVKGYSQTFQLSFSRDASLAQDVGTLYLCQVPRAGVLSTFEPPFGVRPLAEPVLWSQTIRDLRNGSYSVDMFAPKDAVPRLSASREVSEDFLVRVARPLKRGTELLVPSGFVQCPVVRHETTTVEGYQARCDRSRAYGGGCAGFGAGAPSATLKAGYYLGLVAIQQGVPLTDFTGFEVGPKAHFSCAPFIDGKPAKGAVGYLKGTVNAAPGYYAMLRPENGAAYFFRVE